MGSLGRMFLALAVAGAVPPSHTVKKGPPMTPILQRAADMGFDDYDPSVVVQAVNALQPLGHEAALQQIDSVLAARDKGRYPFGLLWVARVLFELPPSEAFPPVRAGQPSIPPPADPAKLPRFPIVLIHDIPFLLSGGYLLRGLPEPPEAHLAVYRARGAVRARPLAPPAPLDRARVEAEARRAWKDAYADAHAAQAAELIRQQLSRMHP